MEQTLIKTRTGYACKCPQGTCRGYDFSSVRATSILIMANRTVSVAVLLLVFSLQEVKCQQFGFRVFRTEAELREFKQLSERERFDAALLYPGAEILEITGENQAATVQEGTSLYIDCLPWLQQFQPNGSIQWYSIELDLNGNVLGDITILNSQQFPQIISIW